MQVLAPPVNYRCKSKLTCSCTDVVTFDSYPFRPPVLPLAAAILGSSPPENNGSTDEADETRTSMAWW